MALAFLLMAMPALAADWQLGVETDIVIEKEVELENLSLDADYSAQYCDLTLETKIGDWLTLTPKAGLNYSKMEADTPVGEIEATNELGWNVGLDAKADVYTVPNINVDISLIGSYRFSKTEIDEFDIGGLVIENPIETDLTIHEYELGAIASKDLKDQGIPITPYIGVVYSDLRGDIDVNLSVVDLNEDIEAKDNVGLRTGFSAEPIENLKIGVDVKLVDETAIAGKASYKF